MSVGAVGSRPSVELHSEDPQTEIALVLMRNAQQSEKDHAAEWQGAKNRVIDEGARQVAKMREAADHDLDAARTGAVMTIASGAVQVVGAGMQVDDPTGATAKRGQVVEKLGDVGGRSAPYVSKLNGGHAADVARADATQHDHGAQVARMDFDQARERASRDRDVQRSAQDGLRSALSQQHESRMQLIRG